MSGRLNAVVLIQNTATQRRGYSKREKYLKKFTASERIGTMFFSRQMNSRSVHNRRSSQLLYRLLDLRDWDELRLAQVAGVLPTVVSAHLSGRRPIRQQHLGAYLTVIDRPERSALLDAWLQDNANREMIANLLNGTRTDSMRSVEDNQLRMLDWWAMAIARDFKLAKIFRRFRSKAVRVPVELLSLVSTTAVQFEGWILEKAYVLFARVKHATVAVVTLLLALCQPDKVTQQAGQVAQRGGDLARTTIANPLLAASFTAPALADTTNFSFDWRSPSPAAETRKTANSSRVSAKSSRRPQPKRRVAAAKRIQRTIGHEWRKLVNARKSVHSAFGRLVREAAAPRQSSQTQRKQRRS